MTDEEHSKEVRQCLKELNAAILRAAETGLRIELSDLDIRTIKDKFAVPHLNITICREL